MLSPADGAGRVPDPIRTAAAWSWRLLVLLAAVGLFFFIVSKLLLVVLPVIGALLLATVLVPPVNWLARRGWPRLLATWTVLLAALGLLGGILALLVVQSIDELERLDLRVQIGLNDVTDWVVRTFPVSEAQVDMLVENATDAFELSGIGESVVSGTVVALETIAGSLLALVLLFFFLKDGERMWGWLAGAVGERRRGHVDELGRRGFRVLGSYVYGSAVVGAFNAILLAVVLLVLGVPLVIPIAVITLFAAFFPIVGGVAAGSIAALVTLASNGLVDALIVVAATIVIQQVEGDVLQPLVLGRAVRLHPVVILLSLTAGATVAGIIGAFVAVPLAAVAVAWGSYLRGLSADAGGDETAHRGASTPSPPSQPNPG